MPRDDGCARGLPSGPSTNRNDVILCMNVSIDFRPKMTRRLVGRGHAVSPGGYLLLAHSESLWQMEEGLTLVEDDSIFWRQKPSPVHDLKEPVTPRRDVLPDAVHRLERLRGKW